MRQFLGWLLAAGVSVLPLVAVWLSRSAVPRRAAQRLRRGDGARRADRSRPRLPEAGPPQVPASERALVRRLLAGDLDPATYRDAMSVLARREATRWHWNRQELDPP